MLEVLLQIIQLLLSLSILVVLHEFGHYAAAKFFGCRVEKFYLFMDWKFALYKKQIGETEFGIGWLPLGGYVKIAGFVDESMDTDGVESEPQPWELRAKPAWQRLIVMLAGIFINLVLAWGIYSMILFSYGEKYVPMDNLTDGFAFNEQAQEYGFQDGDLLISINNGDSILEYNQALSFNLFFGDWEIEENTKYKSINIIRNGKPKSIKIYKDSIVSLLKHDIASIRTFLMPRIKNWTISQVQTGSVADSINLKKGDQIIAINDFEVVYYNAEAKKSLKAGVGKPMTLTIKKANGNIQMIRDIVIPVNNPKLGVVSSLDYLQEHRSYSFFNSIPAGLWRAVDALSLYWLNMKLMFDLEIQGWKHMGGMLTIGSMFDGEVDQSGGWSWNWFWEKVESFWLTTAFLSIILAVMNLLPIPALDGGHALIALGEMITRKKVPLKVLMPLQIVGMVILLVLVLYANGMDVVRYIVPLFN